MAALTQKQKDEFFALALKGADWFVNTQLGHHRAKWNGDYGRFMYYYYMPEKKHVPGISWTSGRAIFTLAEAYKLTNDQKYLDAAMIGSRWVEAMQVLDPALQSYGVMKEFTPQGDYAGILDGAQAASGIILLGKVTGNKTLLRKGKAFCDFMVRHFKEDEGMVSQVHFYPEERILYGIPYANNACGQAAAIPLWHMYCIDKDEKYLRVIKWAADYILACQRADGAMNFVKDIRSEEPPAPNHHWGQGVGDEKYVFHNDDGIMVIVLAAYMATKDKRYLDSAVAYADWMVNTEVPPRPFCAFPLKANNVLDIGKVAGKDYTSWVLDNLQDHLLCLQVNNPDDLQANGGFAGEDEEHEGGIFGGRSLDYVNTRNTCYATGTLLRLSGRGTGSGFSVYGL
ncbi:MAG: hypothetical protein JNL74_06360 [Fibrobacteres bacterium]|nr:hypothetical protein [Fibrobacterota bacterium]